MSTLAEKDMLSFSRNVRQQLPVEPVAKFDDISFTVLGAFRAVNVRTCPNQLPDVLDINLSTYGFHDDVIKWKHFPRYWPFVRGIHRSR